ncbi:MAG TPA: hypothetical protein VKS21_04880, partial [Spirochaetota bacterium]|nr:hypothetical protein [Spirochaetota bacterium]
MPCELIALHQDIADKKTAAEKAAGGPRNFIRVDQLEQSSAAGLVSFLQKYHLGLEQSEFLNEVTDISTVSDLLVNLTGQHEVTFSSELEKDKAAIALAFLWQKWLPQRPCLEYIYYMIYKGYRLQNELNHSELRKLWTEAAGHIFDFVEDNQIKNIELVKEILEGEI